jgi:DNA-directed RNA polymerase specialized sigma subunit
MTQRQIGEEIGVSQMQVSRILRRALNKLLAAVQGQTETEIGRAA